MINTLLLVIFFATLAFLGREGIWSNIITLFNVMTAALLAMNYWEPAADWLESKEASYTYVFDIVCIWGIFGFSIAFLRAATDALSKVKVRFKKMIDLPVGAFFACWTAWILVCFTTTTLHMTPLSRNFLGFQPKPESRMFFGLAPDHRWLAFVQKESNGALSRRQPHTFDPAGETVLKYGGRRGEFEQHFEKTGSLRRSN